MSPDEFGEIMKSIGIIYLIGALITFIGGSIYIHRQRNNYWNTFDGTMLFLATIAWFVLLPLILVEKWSKFLKRID
ncbi:hypothetical protein [Leclercia sp.]|uniref:hypothetical protein n=1 Tax=Leclercia sp. TaxID=1898428 RepID=UPI0028BD6029|nr:hypothetical protein [Leclercia sp.]